MVADLRLKQIYFESIRRCTKKVEYRDFNNDYYIRKFVDMSRYPGKSEAEIRDLLIKGKKLHPLDVTHLRFHAGNREMLVKVEEINVYPGHSTFAIKLGEIVSIR